MADQFKSRSLTKQNQDSRDTCQHGNDNGCLAQIEMEDTRGADDDQINGKKEESDVFGDIHECLVSDLGAGVALKTRTSPLMEVSAESTNRTGRDRGTLLPPRALSVAQ